MVADRFITEFDKALRTVFAPASSSRVVPTVACPAPALTADERTHAAALMRVNHVGEVCAQALYQGQALTCRDAGAREVLGQAADEETEHLAWTECRVNELGGRKSLLNPLWYLSAWSVGVLAGTLGDDWSLGFLAETERQVELHLSRHLRELPAGDARSREIVRQMRRDEIAHAETAIRLGARELPRSARIVMKIASRVMTCTAYYV